MTKQDSAEDIWGDPTGGEGLVGLAQGILYNFKRKKTKRQIDEMKEEAELLKAKAELERIKKELTKEGETNEK